MSEGSARQTPPLLALLASSGLRRQVRIALHSGEVRRIVGRVIFASSWPELARLTQEHPGSPAIVDPFFASYDGPFPTGHGGESADWSAVPLICYSRADPVRHGALRSAGVSFTARLRPGIDDDFAAIDAAVLRSVDQDRPRRLLERLRRHADPRVRTIFANALSLSFEPLTVASLADHLGSSTRALQRRCAALGMPSPKAFTSLARIFTVERLAEWSGQPSGPVARALGFSDRANYRRLARQTMGIPPSVFRQRGGNCVRRAGHHAATGGDPPCRIPGCRNSTPDADALLSHRGRIAELGRGPSAGGIP